MLMHDANNGNSYSGKNWAFNIKTILTEIGMHHIWIEQDSSTIFYLIKQRILDIFKQTWYATINNSRRLASYCIHKHDFHFEKYLNCIQINKYRIALTKFRVSSHDLAVETGRYTNVAVDDRKCQQCSMNVLEDEYHFLLVCPKYRNLRINYLKPYFCHWPSLNKFDSLMSSTSVDTINNLSKYIYSAMKMRQ